MSGAGAAGSPRAAAAAAAARPLLVRILYTCMRAQWLVGGTCAGIAIAYPQVEVYGCIVGAFVNAFLAKLLKRIIAQPRPMFRTPQQPPAVPLDAHGRAVVAEVLKEAASEVAASAVDAALFAADSLGVHHAPPDPLLSALPHPQLSEAHLGHGMPSSHAMSLFYFATYLALAAYDSKLFPTHELETISSLTGLPQPHHPFIQLLQDNLPPWLLASWYHGWARPLLVSLLYLLVSVECWTRIRRRLHSPAQICVGASLGALVATLHAWVVMPLVREASRDVPPLASRSTEFKIVLVICFTIVAALTLERNTQRLAKRLLAHLLAKFTRRAGSVAARSPRSNAASPHSARSPLLVKEGKL